MSKEGVDFRRNRKADAADFVFPRSFCSVSRVGSLVPCVSNLSQSSTAPAPADILFAGFDYFLRFQSDRIAFKLLVGFLLVSTFAHAALISSQAYKLLITNYANPAFIMVLPVQITTEMGILGVNCFVVQAFFLWRLYVLSERKAWAWTGFAALLSLVSWGERG